MKRREFILALGAAAAAWPLAGRAQPAMPVIGYLGTASADQWAGRLRAFRQGLSEAGFVEDHNVSIEYRWAENHYDRLRALAADLVGRGVDVLVAPGSALAALVAKAATTTIPVIFETGADPVAAGIVGNLSRPGGNITGITALAFQLGPKRLELLHELVPAANLLATVINPTAGDVVTRQAQDMQAAARALGIDLVVLKASSDRDIDKVFANLGERRAGGLVIIPDAFTNSRTAQFAAAALSQGVPSIFQARDFVAAGGLMSYGGDISESHRLAGVYTGRILKGEKPAELPVMQATKVELSINMNTAKALGLTVPLPLIGRADEVIE